jgi:hypothetical protein
VEDLTAAEKDYLKKAGNVMMLNFISPMTFGFYRIRLGNEKYGNFAFQAFLNSFGYDLNPEVYYGIVNTTFT